MLCDVGWNVEVDVMVGTATRPNCVLCVMVVGVLHPVCSCVQCITLSEPISNHCVDRCMDR